MWEKKDDGEEKNQKELKLFRKIKFRMEPGVINTTKNQKTDEIISGNEKAAAQKERRKLEYEKGKRELQGWGEGRSERKILGSPRGIKG